MGMRAQNADVLLEDILPSITEQEITKTILSISDIIVRPSALRGSGDLLRHSSIEYDFTLPIDIRKAYDRKVVGLEITLATGPGQIFKTQVDFMKEIVPTIDIGESDYQSLIKEVLKPRRKAVTSDNPDINLGTVERSPGRDNLSGQTTMSVSALAKDLVKNRHVNLDALVPGSTSDLESGNQEEKDFYLKPPKKVSDGTNRDGISLVRIKEEIIERDIAEGKYAAGSRFHTIKSILEPDFSGNLRDEDTLTIRYSSPIVPIRRIMRINTSRLDPFDGIAVGVTPILDNSVKDIGAKGRGFIVNRMSDIRNIIMPVGVPEIQAISQCPGYATFVVTKKDPTLFEGKVVVEYVNPLNPSMVIEGQEKRIQFNESVESFALEGLHNVEPLIAYVSFFTLDEQRRAVKSKTINLKSFKGSIDQMMPELKRHSDTINLTTLNTNEGVRISIEGSAESANKMSLYREDLSSPKDSLRRTRKLADLSDTDGKSFLDINVVPEKTYMYYIVYERTDPTRSFVTNPDENNKFPLELGQTGIGITRHRSISDSTIRFRKSKIITPIDISNPEIKSVNSRPGVEIIVSYPSNPRDLATEEILKVVGNSRAETEGEIGLDRKALNKEIASVIVERINRVTGDTAIVGVSLLNVSGETSIFDTSIFSDPNSPESLTGRYTYVFRICRPTVGALYQVAIPLKNEDQGTSNQTFKINALKYTSNLFYDQGILVNSVKVDQSYLEILRSFETGERVYREFDPFPSDRFDSLVSEIQVEVTEQNNGYKIYWSPPDELRRSVDAYLIYRIVRGRKKLVGSIKSSFFNDEYSYFDAVSFVRTILISRTEYSLVPITKAGEVLSSTSPVGPAVNNISNIVSIANKIPKYSDTFLL